MPTILTDDDIRVVMSTENGRRFVSHLIEVAGVDSQVFTGEIQRDTFNAGRREAGLYLQTLVSQNDFELYIRMLRENHNAS